MLGAPPRPIIRSLTVAAILFLSGLQYVGPWWQLDSRSVGLEGAPDIPPIAPGLSDGAVFSFVCVVLGLTASVFVIRRSKYALIASWLYCALASIWTLNVLLWDPSWSYEIFWPYATYRWTLLGLVSLLLVWSALGLRRLIELDLEG